MKCVHCEKTFLKRSVYLLHISNCSKPLIADYSHKVQKQGLLKKDSMNLSKDTSSNDNSPDTSKDESSYDDSMNPFIDMSSSDDPLDPSKDTSSITEESHPLVCHTPVPEIPNISNDDSLEPSKDTRRSDDSMESFKDMSNNDDSPVLPREMSSIPSGHLRIVSADIALNILNKEIERIKAERDKARKINNGILARNKSTHIESLHAIVDAIEDLMPTAVEIEFESEEESRPLVCHIPVPETPNIAKDDSQDPSKDTSSYNDSMDPFKDMRRNEDSPNLSLKDTSCCIATEESQPLVCHIPVSETSNIAKDDSQDPSKDTSSYNDTMDPLKDMRSNEDSPNLSKDTSCIATGSSRKSLNKGSNHKMKKNWCQFCKTFQTKFGRHLTLKHKDVPEVQKYLEIVDSSTTVQKRKRREICKLLLNQSNSKYNENVLKQELSGKPIPVRQTKTNPSVTTHVLCTVCRGLITKKHFAAHKVTCKQRVELLGIDPNIAVSSRVMLPSLENRYNLLQTKVLDKMNKDAISLMVHQDPLILEFGRRFLKGHMDDHQRNYNSSKLRTLADLVLRMKTKNKNITSLKDCLNPINFDVLCDVVREWGKYDEESGVCDKGSVARRLCKSLKMCSQIVWSQAIKDKTLSVEEQVIIRDAHEKFTSLMETDWAMEISSAADKSIKVKKMIGEIKMPLEKDLQTYFETMKTIMQQATQDLENLKTTENFNRLTTATLAFLIAFNSRRPGEVAHATINNYNNLEHDQNNKDSLYVFNVSASKNNVRVPIIVPNTAKLAIDTLIVHRALFKIPGELLFPRIDGTAYNGSTLVSKYVSNMKLEKPKDFTANGLRHYWATSSQSNPELKKHMPKFLGHTLNTHQKFYEMPLTDLQLNLIGPHILKRCFTSSEEQRLDENSELIPNEPSSTFSAPEGTKRQHQENQTDTLSRRETRKVRRTCNKSPLITNSLEFNEESPEPSSTFSAAEGTKLQHQENKTDTLSRRETRKVHRTRNILSPLTNSLEFNEESPIDNTSSDPDFDVKNGLVTPTKVKRKLKRNPCFEEDSSSDDSTSSPLPVRKKNRWTTPERLEIFKNLPKTVLGREKAERGAIEKLWKNSSTIRKRHSLQMLRIEVSKYYTSKKKIRTPEKAKILAEMDEN